MDAPTTVALVLGSAGFLWGAASFFITRQDARSTRWIQEKRILYVQVQQALNELYGVLTDIDAGGADDPARWPDGYEERFNDAAEKALAVAAEVDLIAPPKVQEAVSYVVGLMTEEFEQYGRNSKYLTWDITWARRSHVQAVAVMRRDLGLDLQGPLVVTGPVTMLRRYAAGKTLRGARRRYVFRPTRYRRGRAGSSAPDI